MISDIKFADLDGDKSNELVIVGEWMPITILKYKNGKYVNNPKRKLEKYHIVAEMKNQENLPAATLVGGDEATIVLSPDLIARVTAQTCR